MPWNLCSSHDTAKDMKSNDTEHLVLLTSHSLDNSEAWKTLNVTALFLD